LLKPFFNKVVFHNAKKSFQDKKARNLLSKLGVYWESYHDVPVKVWCHSYKDLNQRLGQAALKNNIVTNQIYSTLVNYYQFNKDGQAKLNAVIINDLCGEWLVEGTSSFCLIDYKYPKSKYNISYLPKTLGNYLLATEHDRSIKPISVYIISKGILEILAFIAKTSIKGLFKAIKLITVSGRIYRREDSNSQNKNCKIAFVPHAGMKYGEFFKKTYLFEDNQKSILHKDNLLILAFNDFDPISERYCRLYKIPFGNISTRPMKLEIVFFIFKYIITGKLIRYIIGNLNFKNLSATLIIIKRFIMLSYFLKNIDNYPKLKLIYFHYDIHANSTFVLACYLKKIITVSAQERPISSIWGNKLIFDHYLLSGSFFEKIYNNRGSVIGKYHVIGLPRSSNIKLSKLEHNFDKIIKIKNKYTLSVCYDIFPLSFFQEGLESETPSKKSIKDFYKALIKLSKDYPNIFFVVRPKSVHLLQEKFFRKIISEINLIDNIKILSDLIKYNSYSLAYLADIIIGKHSTILEEAFAFGKKVIFYDSEKYLKNSGYIYNKSNLVVHNYKSLSDRIKSFTTNDKSQAIDENQTLKNNYFYHNNDKDGFTLLRDKVKYIYNSKL